MPWVKGQSGNPGGRPRLPRTLIELARDNTQAAMDVLLTIMKDESAAPSARAKCAEIILERGWGRAPQEVRVSGQVEFWKPAPSDAALV